MYKKIRFCYRKIIDSNSASAWEGLVFEDSFTEFKMQAQNFNDNKYQTFAEIVQSNVDTEKLNFLVSATAIGYIKQLNNIVPDIVNTLGQKALIFKEFKFEIINSDINNIAKHQVAINFYSQPMYWINTVADYFIVANDLPQINEPILTNTIKFQPFLSVYSIQ